MDGLSERAHFAGTPASVAELLDGIVRVLSEESDAAEAIGNDHGSAVLICVMADVLDAVDALGE